LNSYMKRTLLAVAMLALFLPAAQVSKGADVSVDFFYNNLSGGSWIEVADYGYCWQPDVVVSNTSWRPYSDGYWAYTDLGWTWVSYEDFGWATYHYGRWARLADYGWCWVPGRDEDLEWGPAWVSWRTGGEYIGWAPLPPGGARVYEGGAISGHVDVEFDIGPAYYNFVDVRYIGEPVLRERIVDVSQNVTYVNQTVNVTNITYKNKVVYNYGPDINVINTRATRPIQRLKLERQENVDVSVAAKSGGLTKVQGDKLIVGAPLHIKKSAQQVAPPKVKAKVTQAKLDRGWSGVSDPNAQAQLKQKMKTEDAKQGAIGAAPGPAGAGASPAAGAANVTGAASPAGSPGASPFERGRKGKHGEKTDVTGAQPSGSPAGAASPAGAGAGFERGKGKGKRGEMPTTGAPGGSPAGAAATSESSPTGEAAKATNLNSSKSNIYKSTTPNPPATAPTGAGEGTMQPGEQGQGKHKGRRLEQPAGAQGVQPPTGTGAEGEPGAASGGRGRQKAREIQPGGAPAGGGPAAAGGEAQGKGQGKGEGKKQKGEASPVPSPQ
jgi:hypothetical protein